MTTNSDILPFFWDLASLDEEKRIKAAEQLLTRLTEVQQQHRNDIEDVIWKDLLKGEQTEEILEKLCAKDVLYTLKRLIRGLSSSRKAARQGFALAFTELLRILEFIHIKLLIDMIMKATEINSQMNGQEERDMLFGRIFGFLSIVRSGLLCHQLATMEENVMKMVNELLTYGKSKPFLREAVHHVFCEMIPQLLACKKQGQTVLQHMSAKILENDIQTPDALLYALTLERHGIDKVYEYTPSLKKPYLQESNLKKLATILRESSTQGQSDLYSVWHPQLHSVWEYILPQLYEKDAVNDLPFHRCWKTLVDGK
jgi:DNA polymerase phi